MRCFGYLRRLRLFGSGRFLLLQSADGVPITGCLFVLLRFDGAFQQLLKLSLAHLFCILLGTAFRELAGVRGVAVQLFHGRRDGVLKGGVAFGTAGLSAMRKFAKAHTAERADRGLLERAGVRRAEHSAKQFTEQRFAFFRKREWVEILEIFVQKPFFGGTVMTQMQFRDLSVFV